MEVGGSNALLSPLFVSGLNGCEGLDPGEQSRQYSVKGRIPRLDFGVSGVDTNAVASLNGVVVEQPSSLFDGIEVLALGI